MDRLPLTDIISVDEVFLELDEHCKYALFIQDFLTGDPIDLLSNRRTDSTEPYFMNIPLKEQASVKYLISDMYNPYIQWVGKYFPYAVPVVDAFYVIQWIIQKSTCISEILLSTTSGVTVKRTLQTAESSPKTQAFLYLAKCIYYNNIVG